MTGTPIDLIWVIPALPLLAIVINFLFIRPFDSRQQGSGRPQAVVTASGQVLADPHTIAEALAKEEPGPTHETTLSGHGAAPEHGAAGPATHVVEHEEEHGAHDEHGGIGGPNFPATLVSIVALAAVFLAFLVSCAIAWQFLTDAALQKNGTPVFAVYPWFSFGPLNYSIDLRIDTLTVVMLIVVTSVSTLVHLFSIGYMAKDPGYSRFFIELSLFTFSMLILVLGANFLVLFIGWELVGLSSYLLIGFFYGAAPPPPGSEVPYPPPAQLKAFIVTRLGDFGFLIGILILFTTTGTFNFLQLQTLTPTVPVALVTGALVLVFCGAIGKSAQFPLHVWLPDAMAGPTPVSALIHAATMVAAGVYLVARLFPIFAHVAGPEAMLVVGYIGGFTALFAATIALTQYDIKGVLAYSTISQLGYMFVGLAMGETTNAIGMNHLFTHAFFKALLFLGSGVVIHAIAGQDMRVMGGLARWLGLTAVTMLVATFAISGIPLFSGFWSKDPIIGAAFDQGQYVLYGMVLFTAFLTAFYMFRLYFLTFGGPGGAFAGFGGGEAQYRGEAHPHAPAWVMWLPLLLLALATLVIGIWGFFGYDQAFATFLNGGTLPNAAVAPGLDPLTLIGVGVAVLGILLSWTMYGAGIIPQNAFTNNPVGGAIRTLLYNRYYLNEFYNGVIVRYVALGLAGACAWFDAHIIDGLVNGSAKAVLGIGRVTRRSETGFLQNYGAALFGGALLLMILLFFAVGALGR
jgi:proton-translocating NADH-quinone oxidoreductase chain L